MNSNKAIRSFQGGWLFVFRVFSVVAAAMAVGGCVAPWGSVPQTPVGTIGLKRTLNESLLTFEAMIGEGPMSRTVHFVVDTGAEVSGILGEHAHGLTPTGAALPVIGLHGGRLDGIVVRSPLRSTSGGNLFGDRQAVGAEMVVLPPRARLPGRTQGLVGIDCLKANTSYLDVAKKQLAARPMTFRSPGGVAVELLSGSSHGGDLLLVAGEYRGQRLVWLLDTGASQTLLSQRTAEKIGLRGIGKVSHLIDSGGQRVAVRHSMLRNTRWGKAGHSLSTLPVGITELPHLEAVRLGNGSSIDGVLGIDMLIRCAAVIDFQSDEMWLNLSP